VIQTPADSQLSSQLVRLAVQLAAASPVFPRTDHIRKEVILLDSIIFISVFLSSIIFSEGFSRKNAKHDLKRSKKITFFSGRRRAVGALQIRKKNLGTLWLLTLIR
jgi:hypothetical protein